MQMVGDSKRQVSLSFFSFLSCSFQSGLSGWPLGPPDHTSTFRLFSARQQQVKFYPCNSLVLSSVFKAKIQRTKKLNLFIYVLYLDILNYTNRKEARIHNYLEKSTRKGERSLLSSCQNITCFEVSKDEKLQCIAYNFISL